MAPPVTKIMSCSGCSQDIVNKQFLKCSHCSKFFDLLCANITERRFNNILTAEFKKKWKCQECVSKEPKTDNTNTPIKRDLPSCADTEKNYEFVTLRTRPNPNNSCAATLLPVSPPFPAAISAGSELITELRLFREEMKNEMREFRNVVAELTAAVNSCNRRMDALAVRVEAIERSQSERAVATDVTFLEKAISELKHELNERDQELLRNDIEIAGIPEDNNELSIHLALTVASKLGMTLEDRDIVSAERAGPVRRVEDPAARPRPRPLVVRLARRTHRDQLLAAARVRRGVTTAGLGLDSDAHRLHINERLTRTNRQLFYKARGEALRTNWKFVWTRDGKIFARKEHGSPRFRLCSEDELVRVFG